MAILVLKSHHLTCIQLSSGPIIVGVLYCAICILGISAVFYPGRCSGFFGKSQNPASDTGKASVGIKGHHPDCPNYSANRIRLGKRTVCASCSGLLVGAIIGVIGAVSYFFFGLNILGNNVWLLVVGEICMLLGLAQIKFAAYSKVVMNALFVIGSWVTLVETDSLGKNLLIDFFALGLTTFILWLRIIISEWNNGRTCRACQKCFD